MTTAAREQRSGVYQQSVEAAGHALQLMSHDTHTRLGHRIFAETAGAKVIAAVVPVIVEELRQLESEYADGGYMRGFGRAVTVLEQLFAVEVRERSAEPPHVRGEN